MCRVIQAFSEEQIERLANMSRIYEQAYQNQFANVMQTIVQVQEQVQESMAQAVVQLQNLAEQYRTAIQEGINNFETPDLYDPTTVTIHPWTRGYVLNTGSRITNDFENSPFDYLSERYNEGFRAFIEKDFQKSIFTFLSCLDGILREFCVRLREIDCPFDRGDPTHHQTFDHFMMHYNLEILAGNEEFHDRLVAFFEHRHEIMHGGRNVHFDENIAIISLLFLGLVFYTVKNDI